MKCPLHNVEMTLQPDKGYGPWYSHIIPNVGFCNGKKITPFKTPLATPTPEVQAAEEAFSEPIGKRVEDTETNETREKVNPEVWKAKDRMNMAQTAIRGASEIISSAIEHGNEDVVTNREAQLLYLADVIFHYLESKKIGDGKTIKMILSEVELPF